MQMLSEERMAELVAKEKILQGMSAAGDAMVFAWVIEHADSPPGAPRYFTGKRHPAMRWSDPGDHLAACRFARREDAERISDFAGYYLPNPTHRVREHGWYADASLVGGADVHFAGAGNMVAAETAEGATLTDANPEADYVGSDPLLEEAAGWKAEAKRLLELSQKQARRIEELEPFVSLFRRLDERFGCNHTDNGAEDAENLIRHIDEALAAAAPAEASPPGTRPRLPDAQSA
jgi:hypothetical protein